MLLISDDIVLDYIYIYIRWYKKTPRSEIHWVFTMMISITQGRWQSSSQKVRFIYPYDPCWCWCEDLRILKATYGAFLKWRYPKMDGLQGNILLKWLIWGYPHFRKLPYILASGMYQLFWGVPSGNLWHSNAFHGLFLDDLLLKNGLFQFATVDGCEIRITSWKRWVYPIIYIVSEPSHYLVVQDFARLRVHRMFTIFPKDTPVLTNSGRSSSMSIWQSLASRSVAKEANCHPFPIPIFEHGQSWRPHEYII